MEYGRTWNYKDPGLLSWFVIASLIILALFNVVLLLSSLSEIAALKTRGEEYFTTIQEEHDAALAEMESSAYEDALKEDFINEGEVTQGCLDCIIVSGCLVFLCFLVLFLIWVYKSNVNARALGAEDMQFSPGWAVGYLFIPLLNLVKFVQAVNEIYQASDPMDPPGTSVRGKRWSVLVLIWWILWITSGIVPNLASGYESETATDFWSAVAPIGATLEDQVAINTVDAVSGAISIVAQICLIFVVLKITHRQQEKYETHFGYGY